MDTVGLAVSIFTQAYYHRKYSPGNFFVVHPTWCSKNSVRYELLTSVKTDKVATSPITQRKPQKTKGQQQKPDTSRKRLNEAVNAPPRERKRQKLSVGKSDGDVSEISIDKCETTSYTAGLFSSVLSAATARNTPDENSDENPDESAMKQARLLTGAVRAFVREMNTTRRLATQFANILFGLLKEGDYDQNFKRMVYQNFYQSSRSTRGKLGKASGSSGSAAMKTWTWLLHMATAYTHKSVNKNKFPSVEYNPDERPVLSSTGLIDNPNSLIAFPNDIAIRSLVQLTADNRPLGNLMLLARRVWWEGYQGRWEQAPALMESARRSHLIDDAAQVLDSNFRTACSHNFIKRYIELLRARLAIKAGVPKGWPPATDLLRWLHKDDNNRHADAKTIQAAFPTVEESTAKKIAKFLRKQNDVAVLTQQHLAQAAISIKTQPSYWPQSASLPEYIFAKIFSIDRLDIFENLDELLKVEEEVEDLDQAAKEALTDFIETERETLENAYGYPIVQKQTANNQVDLLRCLGISKAAPGSGSTERQYGFLVQATIWMRRFPFMSPFAICPTADPMSSKAIGFTDVFITTFLQNLGDFLPDADPEIVDSIQSDFESHEGSSIEFLFDIKEKATVAKGNRVQVIKRDYDRKLRKTIQDTDGNEVKRFVCANRFTTDGILCNAYYRDWCTPAKKDKKLDLPDVSTMFGRTDIGGVIGVDFGQTYTAAAFYLPIADADEDQECEFVHISVSCMLWLLTVYRRCSSGHQA